MKSIHPRVLTFALAGLLGAASASVLAQSMPDTAAGVSAPAPAMGAPSVDRNGDGKRSLGESKAQGGEERAFTGIDANQDKKMSKDGFSKMGKPRTERN